MKQYGKFLTQVITKNRSFSGRFFYSKYACTGTPHGHLAKLDGTIYQWKEKRQQSPNGFDPRHDSCRGTGIGGSVNKRRDTQAAPLICLFFVSHHSLCRTISTVPSQVLKMVSKTAYPVVVKTNPLVRPPNWDGS